MIDNADINIDEYINDTYLKFNRIMAPFINGSSTEINISEDKSSIMYTITFFLLPIIKKKIHEIPIFVDEKHHIKESIDSNGRRCIIMCIPQEPTFNKAREYEYEVLEYCSKFIAMISSVNQTSAIPKDKIYVVDIMDKITNALENKFENGKLNRSHYKDRTVVTLYTTEERFDLSNMIFPYTTVMKMTYGVLFIFDYPDEISSNILNEFYKILYI